MGVSAQAWAHLLEAGATRHFEPGEVLLRQGDPGTHVLALLAGRVKITLTSPDGDVLVLAIRGAREILGEMAVLGLDDRSATVTAVEPCLTRVIPAERFRQLMRSEALESEFLRHAMARIRESEEWRAELATLPAGPRLARTLLQLLPADLEVPADIVLSQAELGQAAGLSRSTVAAELGRLRGQGAIGTGRGHIWILDLARLRSASQTRRNV